MDGVIDVSGYSFRAKLTGIAQGKIGTCMILEALGFPGKILLPLNRVDGPDIIFITDELQLKFPDDNTGDVKVKIIKKGES